MEVSAKAVRQNEQERGGSPQSVWGEGEASGWQSLGCLWTAGDSTEPLCHSDFHLIRACEVGGVELTRKERKVPHRVGWSGSGVLAHSGP